MNILFITVGTSALINDHIGRAPDDRDNASLKAEVRRYLTDPHQHEKRWVRLREDLIHAHLRYWRASQAFSADPLHFEYTSAELTSTMSLLQRPDCRPDRLVLLCSDTNPGKFAAHINEEVLRELNPRLPVESKEVPNLDVQFKDIRAALEHIFEQDYRLQPGDRVTLNITGGYKGTIPFLTYFAMKNKDWQLYFQHRENNSTVRLEFKDGEPQAEEEEYTLWPSQN